MTMPCNVSLSSVVIPPNTVSSVEPNSVSQNAAPAAGRLPTSILYWSNDPAGSPGTIVGHVPSRFDTSIARMYFLFTSTHSYIYNIQLSSSSFKNNDCRLEGVRCYRPLRCSFMCNEKTCCNKINCSIFCT